MPEVTKVALLKALHQPHSEFGSHVLIIRERPDRRAALLHHRSESHGAYPDPLRPCPAAVRHSGRQIAAPATAVQRVTCLSYCQPPCNRAPNVTPAWRLAGSRSYREVNLTAVADRGSAAPHPVISGKLCTLFSISRACSRGLRVPADERWRSFSPSAVPSDVSHNLAHEGATTVLN